MEKILQRLTDIFRDVFENDELELTENATAEDVDGWDSLMHVTLIVNVEKAFGLRFNTAEIAGLKNVGDLARMVHRHLEAAGRTA